MSKVIVEFEVNTQHVGRGYFEGKLEMDMHVFDMRGQDQIKVTKIIAPENWK
jgi:hypothetical protein